MRVFRYVVAFVVAPAVPAALVSAPSLLFGASTASGMTVLKIACLVSYAHALILGVPAALALNWLCQLTRSRVLGVAFLVGALPLTVFSIYQETAMSPDWSASFNGIQHRLEGRLTGAGWASTIEGILFCGVLGAVAGLVWWWLSRVGQKSGRITVATDQ